MLQFVFNLHEKNECTVLQAVAFMKLLYLEREQSSDLIKIVFSGLATSNC